MISCSCDTNKQHGTSCPILREFAQLKTPEGRAAAREAYLDEVRERAGQRWAQDVSYRLQKAGVPSDVTQALRKHHATRAVAAAKRFLDMPKGQPRTLLLWGLPGTGKSVAAAYVLGELAKAFDWDAAPSGGKPVVPIAWMAAAELTQQTEFGRVSPEWLDDLHRATTLVVDDVGEESTKAGAAALVDLLKRRYEHRLATVITTNMNPETLRERYGEALWSRLATAMSPDLTKEKSLRRRP